ncbi:PIF1 [Branchiostoma lanceolatum]|uniref:ATP-dependent DNA helicase PIF1 n=1 Tax=Branchiostoma lanceolatum TaxID=7740 RepID=A0A8J9YYF7_BRALA|nr:PIF1 [Branchiostoma lanceolatum]
MDYDISELSCSVAVQSLAPTGEVLKNKLFKNITLILLRNEFRDIILKIDQGKTDVKYPLQDIKVFSRFAKDGKATIRIPGQKIQLLISNCPPAKLVLFLRTIGAKVEQLKQVGVASDRQRLRSNLPRRLEHISPLCQKDLDAVNRTREAQATAALKGRTPGLKRKRPLGDTTNAQVDAVPRKKLHMSSTVSRLTKEQQAVLNAVQAGHNIFFTGSAGTGKSFLLRKVIGALPPEHTFATASTGVAACHIGGTTLHSFAGIGSGTAPIQQCYELASRPGVRKQWKQCRHLIVDEVSMIDGDFFDKLEAVARATRKSDKPFGGIQLILCGDFLQLPPVTKPGEKRRFCFQSRSWHKCIQASYELTQVKRQTDPTFINILQNIRVGRCPPAISTRLSATENHQIEREDIVATRLCTHKEDVNHINDVRLKELEGDTKSFEAHDSDPDLIKTINTLCPVEKTIQLKVGAQVMLAKNLDVQRGLVNGARGVVTGFQTSGAGLPIVKFLCGVTEPVKHERWTFKATGGIYLTRRQLPIKLAWAISIHKSQGMSLDCVEMSLSRVFESGQAYVALSRARSLQGLRVLDFDGKCVRANPDVLQFYQRLRKQQRMMQASMDRYVDKENMQPTW